MKLIIMGAGYVGMALLHHLQTLPHEIFITTTHKERVIALSQYGHVLPLDATSNTALKELIDSCDGMVVLVAPCNSQNYEETYLNTAKKIYSSLKDRRTPFYLVYTSSTSVCEGVQSEWVTEDMPLNPQSKNGKILIETERCYLSCDASVCLLRLGGIYGPGRELTDRARRLSGKEMPGKGNESTNHTHLEDIVNAIAFCLKHSLSGIYHLVNDDHPTRNELYSSLCQSMMIPNPIWNPNLSEGKIKSYKVSNQKIKETGFNLNHPDLTSVEL